MVSQLVPCMLLLSLGFCSAAAAKGFLSGSSTTEAFKECDEQDRFNVFMCTSFMCSRCTMEFCTEKCQKIQDQFPDCRCPSWPDARASFSGGDFEGKDRFGDVGDYAQGGKDDKEAPMEEPPSEQPVDVPVTVSLQTVITTTPATTTVAAPGEPDLTGPFGKLLLKSWGKPILTEGIADKSAMEEAIGDALSTMGGCGEKDCQAHLGTSNEKFPGVWYHEFKFACKTCDEKVLDQVACRSKSSCEAANQQIKKESMILNEMYGHYDGSEYPVVVTRICSPGTCP